MELSTSTHGYYRISITVSSGQKLLRTNGDRAFIITQLQDLLSPRLILGDIPAYRQLASCIDLLAFSIQPSSVELLLFTIDATIANDFVHRIIARLSQYQYEYRPNQHGISSEPRVTIHALNGAHHALEESIIIHRLHDDWEFDRYSSIGFFLHDRRGDWMRLWRLTQLYDNEAVVYREFVTHRVRANHSPKLVTRPRWPLPAS